MKENNWWNLVAPGHSLDWEQVDTDYPTLCLNAAIKGAPRCDVLLIRDKPNRYHSTAMEWMMKLRPVLCVYDNREAEKSWRNYLSGKVLPDKAVRADQPILPHIPKNKQPAAIQTIDWTGVVCGKTTPFRWAATEVSVNPRKGIFTALLYVAQYTKVIKLYGVDMKDKGYFDKDIEVKPQKWTTRWKEERKVMAKMFTAMRKRGWFVSGLPNDFLVEFDLF